jgi:hypothetical protein
MSAFKLALLKITKTNLTKYFKIRILLEFHNYVSRHGIIGHIVSVTFLCTQLNRRYQTVTNAKDEKNLNTYTYLPTYSMEQSPSWKVNQFTPSQEIPRILWNPKVH